MRAPRLSVLSESVLVRMGDLPGRRARRLSAQTNRRFDQEKKGQLKRNEQPIVAVRLQDRPKESGSGRICEQPACETILSRYNPGTVCGVHTETGQVGGP